MRWGAPFGNRVSRICIRCARRVSTWYMTRVWVPTPLAWDTGRCMAIWLHVMLMAFARMACQWSITRNKRTCLGVKVRPGKATGHGLNPRGILDVLVQRLSRILGVGICAHVGCHRLRREIGPMNRWLIPLQGGLLLLELARVDLRIPAMVLWILGRMRDCVVVHGWRGLV